MYPFSAITRPVKDLVEAVTMPLRALFVVGLCGFINWMTFSGYWWVQWVAFGMGIAVIVAWARAAKTLLLLGLLAFVGWQLHKRYGAQARAAFDAWAARTQPKAAEVVALFTSPAARERAFGGSQGSAA
jgi:hypothetical protein